MANKILTIQLNADTKQAVASINGVSDALKSMAGNTNFVLSLDKEREKINRRLDDVARAYTERVKKINEIQDETLRKQSLTALENSKGVARTNAELEKQLKLFKDLRAAQLGGLTLPKTEVAKATPTVSTETTPFTLGLSKSAEQLKAEAMARDKIRADEIASMKRHAEEAIAIQRKIDAARKTADDRGYTRQVTANAPMSFTGGATRQIQQQTAALNQQATALEHIDRNYRSIFESTTRLASSVIKSTIIYQTFTRTVGATVDFLQSIPRAGIELESTIASLTSTLGTSEKVVAALASLRNEAERTGIEIGILRENFRGFQASTSLAGATAESTWKMFTNLNTVVTALHLSADQAKGVFNAVSQIFNKSKVQSEELVKQLGNLLPGAFASFAKSMGISTQELAKQMKAGAVFAQDTMENFTEFMATRFSGAFNTAAEGLNANIGRMNSSFTYLKETIYGQIAPALSEGVKGITSLVTGLDSFISKNNAAIKALTIMKDTLIILAGYLSVKLYGSLMMAVTGTDSLTKANVVARTAIMATSAQLTTMTGAATLASAAAARVGTALTAVFANPTVIIAGIALIASRLMDLKTRSDVVRDSVEKINELAAGMRKPKLGETQDSYVQAVIEDNKTLKDATEEAKKIRAKLQEARKELLSTTETDPRKRIASRVVETLISGQKPSLKSKEELQREIKEYETQFREVQDKLAVIRQNAIEDAQTQYEMKNPSIDITKQLQEAEILKAEAVGDYRRKAALDFERSQGQDINNLKEAIKQNENLINQEIKGANRESVINAYKANIDEINEALKAYEMGKTKAIADAVERANKKAETDLNKGFKIDTQGVKADFTEYRQAIQAELSDLQQLYTENGLTLNEYFTRKTELINKDIELQKQANAEELALEQKKGDTLAVEKLREDLAKINITASKEELKLTKEKTAAYQEYNQILMDIKAENAGIAGTSGQGALEQYYAKSFSQFQTLAREGNIEALNMLETNAQFYSLQQKIADIEKQRNNENTLYSNSLQRINVMKEAGSISEFDAMRMITDKNNEHIRQLENKLSLQKQLVEKYTAEGRAVPPEISTSIDTYEVQIEELKSTSDQFANYFRSTMTSAFSDSFAEFVKGTKTAEEAFAGFASSIADALVKLAANQLATSLFSGITGSLAGTGIGNFFGIKAAANGAAVTGMNTGGGKVLTSPTLFPGAKVIPFARGGVLAGEAGAEAVLPLKRGRDGKLGVSAEEGSMGGNVYNIAVTVQGSKSESPEQIGERIAVSMMRSIAREEIANSGRAGNSLNKVNRVM